MTSGIRDNRTRGKVADFLKEKATRGSRLSVVSAYFTIYAYEACPIVRYWLPHVRIINPDGLQQDMENALREYLNAS